MSAPLLNSISPLAGPPGAVIALTGSGFTGAGSSVALVSQSPDFPLSAVPLLLTPISQTDSAIVVQLPASMPGQAAGAIDLFVSVIDSDGVQSAALTVSVTFVGWTTIARVCGEVPAFTRGGKIADSSILNWIRARAQQEIVPAMLGRGYSLDPARWPVVGPGGGSPEACATLEAINRYGAGYDLASKVGGQFSAGGEWIVAKNLRDQWSGAIGTLKAGGYDHLFRVDASTAQVAPSFGGGGASGFGGQKPRFKKDKKY
jgi:hypothetical protein